MLNPKLVHSSLRLLASICRLIFAVIAAMIVVVGPSALCQPTFPASCTYLEAQQASSLSGPTSETEFDTARVQAALDACAQGQAVELTRSKDAGRNAFLIAPISIPSGVTLVIDAGVTVYASRNPQDYFTSAESSHLLGSADARPCGSSLCKPLIHAVSGVESVAAGVMGYGVLDGRGDVLLFETRGTARRTWYDVEQNMRPVLIEASGPFTLYKVTLRGAAAMAVRHLGSGSFMAEGVKVISPANVGDAQGIVIDAGVGSTSLIDVSVSTAATALTLPGTHPLTLRNVALYSGAGILPGLAGSNHCLAQFAEALVCMPASLTPFTGELFLSTPSATNLQAVATGEMVTLNAVVMASDTSVPPPTGVVSFFAEDRLLGVAALKGSLAQLSLRIAEAGAHYIHARYSESRDVAASLSFGAAGVITLSDTPVAIEHSVKPTFISAPQLHSALRLRPADFLPGPVLTLVEEEATVSYGTAIGLSASISPSTATGTVSFVDSVAGILGQSSLTGGVAMLGTPLLAVGSHEITAIYAGDAFNSLQTSGSVTLRVISTTPIMTLGIATPNPVFGSPASITVSLLAAGKPATPLVARHVTTALNQTTDFMGDSIFAWWPLPLHDDGIAGQTAAMMLARFSQNVLDHGYERVILLAGTNDILHTQNDPATTLVSIKAMADLASAAGIPIVLCTLLDITVDGVDMTARVTSLNAAIEAFAAENHYPLIDFHAAFAGHPEWRGDGIHPNADGQNAMEAAVAQTLLFPTGTVSLPDGSSAVLSSTGTATLSASLLQAGAQSLTVSFSGDSNFLPTSKALTFDVAGAPTTTVLGVQTQSILAGSSALLTATVTAPAGIDISGSVTFSDNASTLGTGPLSTGGVATLTAPNLSKGLHSFTATYTGDVHLAQSSSAASPLTESANASSISISSADTNFVSGAPVTITANVLPTSATGTITLYDGGQVLLQAPLTLGTATLTTSALALGNHALLAQYGGDSVNDGAQSGTLNLAVHAGSTRVTLALLPADVAYGTQVTIAASLLPATASGTIVFHDHFAPRGQSGALLADKILGQSSVANGSASLSLSSLVVGTHLLTAVYSGDSSNQPALSTSVSTRVDALASATTLASSSENNTYGALTTLDASVLPASATGTITFVDSLSGILGQVALLHGAAHLPPSTLVPGLHKVSAMYSGDASTLTSISASLSIVVGIAASSIAIVPLAGAVQIGSPSSLTASVSPASASGNVVFRDPVYGVLGEATLLQGVALLPLSHLSAGTYAISASYEGDSSHSSAQSPPASVQVGLRSTTIALSPLPGTLSFGPQLALKATVTPASLTGLVSFFDTSSGLLGSTNIVDGVAGLDVPSLSTGLHSIRAVFAGDNFNSTAMSTPVQTTIAADDSAITLSLAQVAVQAGGIVIFNVRVASSASTVPSGTVVVRSGSKLLSSGLLANASAGLGYASLSVDSAALGVGEFPVAAFYLGDSDHLPSDSSAKAVVLTILPVPTTVELTLPAARILIQSSTMIAASVSTPTTGLVPTGSISFSSNGAVLATVALDSAGSASITLPAPGPGIYTLRANYVATGNFASASAPTQLLTVTLPVALALTPASVDTRPDSSFSSVVALTPLAGFHGPISMRCISPVAWITCTVDGPRSLDSAQVASAKVEVHVDANTAKTYAKADAPRFTPIAETILAILLPFLLGHRSAKISAVRRLRLAASFLALSGITMAISGCTLGGNFFEIRDGTQTIFVAVDVSGMAIATELRVNITR